MKIHIPPRYNQYGNRQLWVVETENSFDEVINGFLFALLIFAPVYGFWLLTKVGFI